MTYNKPMSQFETFLASVKASRTFRRFDEAAPITREQLEALVNAARFAPCARNNQVLRFRVVCNEADRARVFGHLRWAGDLKDWDGPEPGERPGGYVVILGPAAQVKSVMHGYDAGIAAQTIMLAAQTMGLGGCIIKNFDAHLADDLDDLPEGLAPSLVIALGVPAETVVLEPADTPHGLTYWREADGTHHVPKRPLEDLLV